MKRFTRLLFTVLFLMSTTLIIAQDGVIKVVVLGSSTAAGTGPSDPSNAWVNQYRSYLKSINPLSEVVNLAVGGYTTYQVMPSSYTPATGKPSPDASHNITKALSLSPDVIIINLPTNDAACGYTTTEQMYNYSVVLDSAAAQNIPVYVATTQPRNLDTDGRANLIAMRDTIYKYIGDKAIDFWTTIANTDGTINSTYDMGDGVHLNDAAHTVLAQRVEAMDILKYSHDNTVYDTINVDFGGTAALSTGNWNNLTTYATTDAINLINSYGETTGVSMWVHDAFTGVNTSGTTSPDASIGFVSTSTSDSFFGNTADFGGVIEATGGVTMSGLDVSKTYNISIFASRDGSTDNREAMYVIVGSTKDTVYLNASSNTSNIATAKDISPASDGTIIINVAPGPNNNNGSKFYYLGAIRMTYEKEIIYDEDGVINIDLGSAANTTDGNWNNLTSATGGETIADLVNMEGNSSGIAVWVHDAFTGINEYGTTSPDASLDMAASATSDSFFGNIQPFYNVTEPTGGITFSNLDSNSKYTFEIFGSRADGTASDNREVQYTATGKTTETASINTLNNVSNFATIANMQPNDNGTITIVAAPGSNNNNSYGFFYMGAVRVTYGKDITYDEEGTIKIDFGSTPSSGTWNNLADYTTAGSISDLVNTSSNQTGISLSVHDAFTGVNTAGTTSPDASIGFDASATSDSFFGSTGDHSGVIEATGGVTLSGLDINSKYSFTIFASRDGATDNRETQYVITGSEKDTAYLNTSSNTSNVCTIEDMIPADNGTITIDVAPGPNNNNDKGYYYLGAIIINYSKVEVVVDYDKDGIINIDLGGTSNLSTGNWNNLTSPTGSQSINLTNEEGNPTGLSIYVHDIFTDVNKVGTSTPAETLKFDPNASFDSFFGNTGSHEGIVQPTGGVTLAGLNVDSYYSITLFASRDGVTDNREAKYTVTGSTDTTLYLDAANNTSNVVIAENIKPNSEGKITIDATTGPNNNNSVGYFYLGIIRIEYGTSPITDVSDIPFDTDKNDVSIKIYPNPAKEDITLDYFVPEKGNVQVILYNLLGQVESILVNKTQDQGNYSAKLTTSEVNNIHNGIYICQIKVSSTNKVYSKTQKLMVIK
ncbi:MAG: GDSL-type esterase/lipase family protein [Bacteroidales bacterium]